MKTKYTCEVCDRSYDESEAAKTCESNHTVIIPSDYWYWWIPLVAWFMIPFLLITKKNAIIIFNSKNADFKTRFKEELLRTWCIMGPILILCVWGILSILLWKK